MATEKEEIKSTEDEQSTDGQKEPLKEKLMKYPKACLEVLTCYTTCYTTCYNKLKKPEPKTPESVPVYVKAHSDMDEEDPSTQPPETSPQEKPTEQPPVQPFSEEPSEEPPQPKAASQAAKSTQILEGQAYTPPLLGKYPAHTLNSLQSSKTFGSYGDLNKVAEKWTRPLRFSNIKLHTALLKLEFRDLSKKFKDALTDNKPLPNDRHFKDINNNIPTDDGERRDLLKSLIIVSDVFSVFPKHVVKNSVALTKGQRTQLMELMSRMPYHVSTHVFTDPDAILLLNDSHLRSILTRVGFSNQANSPSIEWSDKNLGLDAGLFLLWGTYIKENTD